MATVAANVVVSRQLSISMRWEWSRAAGGLAGLGALLAMTLLLAHSRCDGAERAEVLGAVRFGALFAVHGAPAEAKAGARCGPVREHYGIQVPEGGCA